MNKAIKEKLYKNLSTPPAAGQMLVELVLAIGLMAIILPAILTGLVTSREGKPQQEQRVEAIQLMKETEAAVKSIRDNGWSTFAINGTFHPVISGSSWALSTGASSSGNFSQRVLISDVYRDAAGAIVAEGTAGSTIDLSTKRADITISWTQPQASSIYSTLFLTRTQNNSDSDSEKTEFDAGTYTDLASYTDADPQKNGTIRLSNNNKAKWCSPAFNNETLDLPDGPPVAVAATASAVSNTIPNDVFVATAPSTSSSVKLAHIQVPADVATPAAVLRGKFTMDAAQFSGGYSPQAITGFDNNFRTTDVKYYTSSGGNTYALLGTNLPAREVIAIWVNDGNDATDNEFQDPVNKIYKYKTHFSTDRYANASGDDQSPYGYGTTSMDVLGTRGYMASGGYIYVFRLDNIDSKSPTTALEMHGCRIEVEGYECQANTNPSVKYGAGQTNTSWGSTRSPAHADCSDGGNIEYHATTDIDAIQTSSGTYVFAAVGGGANEEFIIVNATQTPSGSTSPTISSNSCGRYSTSASSNTQWKRIGNWDFNGASGTEEAANSVFARSDGNRAYISSNGGIDGDDNGQPDSKQLYVLNTTSKSNPIFLSGTEATGALNGFYYGIPPNDELYPRRSMTVLNGQRAVLVGSDGVSNGNDSQEYQVLDMETETAPAYCSGINFDQGFNDLTYVSEADYETYVYMVANTTANELKIIEGGPDDAIYVPSGSYESPVFDTASVDGNTGLRAFNRLLANINQPDGTSVEFQLAIAPAGSNGCTDATYEYVGPGGTNDPEDTYKDIDNTGMIEYSHTIPLLSFGGYDNPGRCFRYKIYMETANQMITPYLYDISWNFSY